MLTYGRKTRSTVILTVEAHKLHKAFRVADGGNPVRKSQPVKLTSTGRITALDSADNRNLCIGFSIHDARPGEVATIVMKGYATILCKADAAISPGPVSYTGYSSENPTGDGTTTLPVNPTEEFYGVNTVATALPTAVNIFGHATEVATDAGDPVEVVVLT